MKDHLIDLVNHTHALGTIEFLKIVGSKTETLMFANSQDGAMVSVVISGKFKTPMKEFDSTFGMPNLAKLNVILNIPEYDEDSKITVQTQKKNNEVIPVGLHFENKAGDFKNDYRFMSNEIVNEKLKTYKFKGVKWDVVINPSVSNILRFKFQSQANNEEPFFTVKTDGKNLKFYFGDPSSHAGNFVFEPNVHGTLSKGWAWPVAPVIGILNLVGDKVMKFSDSGALLISVDSGLVEYEYILPAQQK